MSDFTDYKQRTQQQLVNLKMYMHRKDYDRVQQQIDDARTSQSLDGISLSLGFHRHRINAAIERGEIVEVK